MRAAFFLVCVCFSIDIARAEPVAAVGPEPVLNAPKSIANKLQPGGKRKVVQFAKAKPPEKGRLKTVEPWAAVDPGRVAAPLIDEPSSTPVKTKPSLTKAKTDPGAIDLGMKWNGNNDTATQTRVQNYGGDASGAGAEVGLKFHF